MNDSVKKRLEDILKSIEEIEFFYESKPKRFDCFKSDLFYLRAVQMNIAIIGEAMSKVLKECPDIEISSARKIVNTRNYVIHGYDSLREDILWGIVVKDIHVLKPEIVTLLSKD